MKRTLLLLILLSLIFTGCGEKKDPIVPLVQKLSTLEMGNTYTFDDLITVGEGWTLTNTDGVIEKYSVQTFEYSFTVEKDGKKQSFLYTFEVVDTQGPGVSGESNPRILLGKTYDSKVEYTLHDDSGIDESSVNIGEIDTSVAGERMFEIYAKDIYGNETKLKMRYFIEPSGVWLLDKAFKLRKVHVANDFYDDDVLYSIDVQVNDLFKRETLEALNETNTASRFPDIKDEIYEVFDFTIKNTGTTVITSGMFSPTSGLTQGIYVKYWPETEGVEDLEIKLNENQVYTAVGSLDQFKKLSPGESVRLFWVVSAPSNIVTSKDRIYVYTIGATDYYASYYEDTDDGSGLGEN